MRLLLNNTSYKVSSEEDALEIIGSYCQERNLHYELYDKIPKNPKIYKIYSIFELYVDEVMNVHKDYFSYAVISKD